MMKPENKQNTLYLLLILIACAIIYSPSLKNGFVSYDDGENVLTNIYITKFNFDNLKHFFTTPLLYMFTPMVYFSFAIDYSLGEVNPFIYHFTNLLLHLLNVWLTFRLISLLSGKKEIALFAAALFAFHPVNSDTVSWISTRSNLLFTAFYFASLICYINYLKQKSNLKYLASLLFFILSSLSKSAAVTMPLSLLLIDYFKNRKFNKYIFIEKIPFFIVALLTGIATIYFRADALTDQSIPAYSFLNKFFVFAYSAFSYAVKFVFPFNLSALYTYPAAHNGYLSFKYYLIPILFIALLLIFLIRRRKISAEMTFGVLFFLLNIAVNLFGFLEDGFMANRYAYLSMTGLFFPVASFLPASQNKIFKQISIAFLILYCVLTYERCQIWKNSITLFNDVIQKQPDNAFAYNARGIAKYDLQDFNGSVSDYSKAIELNPNYSTAYYNRATSNYYMNDFNRSLSDYSKAIDLNSSSAKSFMGRGIIKMDVMKDFAAAIKDYDKAISLNHDFAQAYYNRGLAKQKSNKISSACEDWKKVQQLGYTRADELINRYCQ